MIRYQKESDHVTAPFVVHAWTGVEIRALRLAKRMSVRAFGDFLGINPSMISRWENGGKNFTPRSFSQQVLDSALALCTDAERDRLAHWREGYNKPPPFGKTAPALPIPETAPTIWYDDPPVRVACALRDVAAIYRALQQRGVSQRRIGALTGQSQSEISEIIAGRTVQAYDVLERIADGLKIPRGYMGLAYEKNAAAVALLFEVK